VFSPHHSQSLATLSSFGLFSCGFFFWSLFSRSCSPSSISIEGFSPPEYPLSPPFVPLIGVSPGPLLAFPAFSLGHVFRRRPPFFLVVVLSPPSNRPLESSHSQHGKSPRDSEFSSFFPASLRHGRCSKKLLHYLTDPLCPRSLRFLIYPSLTHVDFSFAPKLKASAQIDISTGRQTPRQPIPFSSCFDFAFTRIGCLYTRTYAIFRASPNPCCFSKSGSLKSRTLSSPSTDPPPVAPSLNPPDDMYLF